jgi:RHS repeat-associated protein
LSVKDRNDKGLTMAYDGSGRLATVTDATNRAASFTYNTDNLLTGISLPDGRSVTYGYTNGSLSSYTDAAGKTWTYTYDFHNWLEKELDPLSHTVFRNVYTDDGRVKEQYDALNNKTNFSWDYTTQTATATDARNNVWKDVYSNNILAKRIDTQNNQTVFAHDTGINTSGVTSPLSQTTSLTYDSRGNLTHAVAPSSLNAEKTLVYDSQNNLTSVTDARGNVTTYGYDTAGNNTLITQDGQTVASYTYNTAGQMTSSTDGRNNTTTYTYDTNGNLASITDPLGNKTTYIYDNAGRLTSKVEPLGNVTGGNPSLHTWTFTYDGIGHILTGVDPLGHTTTYTYDNAGNKLTVTDANNHTTSYAYDSANRLTSITAPDTGVTSYTYDSVGNKLTETNPRNKTTTYTYDSNNRLASTTTPLGNKTTYFYDANGNQTKTVEARGNVTGANPDDYATTSTYDAAGRLLTTSDPLNHTTTHVYDKVGNQTTITDANNHTTSYAYDGRNRLTSVTAPDNGVTSYTYDGNGNLLTRTDANNHATSYSYDAANRLSSKTLPLSRVWTYSYNANSQLISTVDANGNATQTSGDGTTTESYDRAGRLTGIDYSDATPDVTFAYDNAGNRTSMTDGAGTQTYSYDSANRLTGVTRGNDSFSFAYDLAGNITSRTYPGASAITYSYDNDEQLASVTSNGNTTSYSYDPAGDLTTTTLPSGNGYVETRVYDRAGRLTEVANTKNSTTLSAFTSTLDPVGNPTTIVRSGSISETATYTYDTNDRLAGVCYQTTCPNTSDPYIRWTYDQVGNRLTETRPSGTTNYTYNNADELTAAGTTNYSYDSNGNVTAAGADSFTYDLASRLASATVASTTTNYSYDGDGNRLQASTGAAASQTTNYIWDTSSILPQVAIERDGNNAAVRRYVYGKRRLSFTTGGTDFFYHYDPLGSVEDVTSSTGAAEWRYQYDPFGATRVSTKVDQSAPANPMQYAGELLESTGRYYLRARSYDVTNGRFLSEDPLPPEADSPKVANYAYVALRPTVLIDPTGMTFVPVEDGITVAAGAATPGYTPSEAGPVPAPPIGLPVPGTKTGAAAGLAAIVGAALARCLEKHDIDYCLDRVKKERHHIVARAAAPAAFARSILSGVKIGINDDPNIVRVPYGLHRHLHSVPYYIEINRRMGRAFSRQADGEPKGGVCRRTDTRHVSVVPRGVRDTDRNAVVSSTVFRIAFDASDYQTLTYDLKDPPIDLWHFDGRSRVASWSPQPVYIERPRLQRPDFWHLFGAAVIVMGPPTIEALEPFITAAGELLPLVVSGTNEELLALNVLEDIDCVDPAAYRLDDLILDPHFLEHRLPESGIFKIPQTDTVDIYYVERDYDTDSFRKRILDYGLRGIDFLRVWSSSEGPEPVNLLTD